MTAPELIVDGFAGGGGASTGIEMALGRSPDLAYNHDADALAMHAANHPATRHVCRNIYHVDPADEVGRCPVGLAWFSPDCKHFSKAKGAAPVQRNIRDLAWVVVAWGKRAAPRVIVVENVEEFQGWGPLLEAGDGSLRPDPERKGETFRAWVRALRSLGYRVEWRELRACDYGAPTIRRRLFVVARRDGRPIAWPEPSHGAPSDPEVLAGRRLPWRTAAGIIDWSLPCPSIFLSAEEARAAGCRRPLAEATMARIARGVRRYVLDAAEPFIVPVMHAGDLRSHPVGEPLRTITTARRGEHAVVVPFVSAAQHGGSVRPADAPVHTITASRKDQNAVVAAFLAQHNTGEVGHSPHRPLSTILGKGCTQGVVAAHLLTLRGSDRRDQAADAPLRTVSAGGNHAAAVAAFLVKYYGEGGQWSGLVEPMHTDTTKPRNGLVTVTIAGEPWVIVDIGMRMLTPRERFAAQGFPPGYIIDRGADGRRLSAEAQGRMCGNSVCPPVAAAIVAANCPDLAVQREAAE